MKKPLSNNSFNKWRCLIALSYIDKKLQPTEKQFFVNKFKTMDNAVITQYQMDTFRDDFKKPKVPGTFFHKINDRLEKIDLLRLSYELFWVDGDFDERERKAFEGMKLYLSESMSIDRFVLDDLVKARRKEITMEEVIRKFIEGEPKP